jgi:hypothetical protein
MRFAAVPIPDTPKFELHMPAAEVTKDQFHWEGDMLIHAPSGARFNASSGVADWRNKANLHGDEYDPVEVGYVAGQLLAGRSRPAEPSVADSHEGE